MVNLFMDREGLREGWLIPSPRGRVSRTTLQFVRVSMGHRPYRGVRHQNLKGRSIKFKMGKTEKVKAETRQLHSVTRLSS